MVSIDDGVNTVIQYMMHTGFGGTAGLQSFYEGLVFGHLFAVIFLLMINTHISFLK